MAIALEQAKLITCVLPRGEGKPMLRMLRQRHGIRTANLAHARGTGTMVDAGIGVRITREVEKDVVTVVVPRDRADELFFVIAQEAGVDLRYGSLVYLSSLRGTVPFVLPDLPEEK